MTLLNTTVQQRPWSYLDAGLEAGTFEIASTVASRPWSPSPTDSTMAGKQYGLILPKSKGGGAPAAGRGRGGRGVASAFGEDDSSSSGTAPYLKNLSDLVFNFETAL